MVPSPPWFSVFLYVFFFPLVIADLVTDFLHAHGRTRQS